jgi:hypothetical protein
VTTAADHLCARLRDLALVDLDALTAGASQPDVLIAAYADDVADALRQAQAVMVNLRATLTTRDPLRVLETTPAQRGSEAGVTGADRSGDVLRSQATLARALARICDLTATLVPRLFEADRRR